MPETAAEQFERSIRDLDSIVDELVSSRRRDRVLIAGVFAAVVLGGLTAGFVIENQGDVQRGACRESNVRFDNLLQILESTVDSPEGQQIIDQMRTVSIVDCDGDGSIEDDDGGR